MQQSKPGDFFPVAVFGGGFENSIARRFGSTLRFDRALLDLVQPQFMLCLLQHGLPKGTLDFEKWAVAWNSG